MRGAAALEFALVAPVCLFFLFAMFGVGLDGFYQITLDDAVRDTARQIQIGAPAAASADAFVAALCQEFGLLARDCTSALTYEVEAGTAFASLTPKSLSGSGNLANDFFAGTGQASSNSNVLVQAAYRLPFTLPLIGALITGTGTSVILATAAVRTEPF